MTEVGTQPLVTLVIPTRGRREAVRRALRSLSEQTSDGFEVVVSIDGDTDGTAEMVAAFDAPYELLVADEPWRGRASACNSGLERARGEVTIILDDDMQVVPEFVERHREHHPPGSRLCVLGAVPVELEPDSTLAARFIARRFEDHMAMISAPGHVFVPRDFYSGNASIRTEVLREVGSFDSSYGTYGNEDVELGFRLREAGVEFRYDGRALARQSYLKDLRRLARDTEAKGGTTVALVRAHPDAFGVTRLAEPADASRPWLAARSILLTLTRRIPGTARTVYAFAAALERLGLWRQPLFYRALLDYAVWAGVDAALGEGADEGQLRQLAEQLHRGPIDLLLHR